MAAFWVVCIKDIQPNSGMLSSLVISKIRTIVPKRLGSGVPHWPTNVNPVITFFGCYARLCHNILLLEQIPPPISKLSNETPETLKDANLMLPSARPRNTYVAGMPLLQCEGTAVSLAAVATACDQVQDEKGETMKARWAPNEKNNTNWMFCTWPDQWAIEPLHDQSHSCVSKLVMYMGDK